MFELNDATKEILGKSSFSCGTIAGILRLSGQEIEYTPEDMQAHVIYWMLTMYEKHGDNWKTEGDKELCGIREKYINR